MHAFHADEAFGEAVLAVCIKASEGLALLAIEALGLQVTRLVDAIVASIMMYVDVVRAGKLLKVALGCDSVFAGSCFLVTPVHVFGDNVNKEHGTTVAAFATLTSVERY